MTSSPFEEERPGKLSRKPPRKFRGEEKQESFQRTIQKVSRTMELRRGVGSDSSLLPLKIFNSNMIQHSQKMHITYCIQIIFYVNLNIASIYVSVKHKIQSPTWAKIQTHMLLLCPLQPSPLKCEKIKLNVIFCFIFPVQSVFLLTYVQLDHPDRSLAFLVQTRRRTTLPKIPPRQTGSGTLSTCTAINEKFKCIKENWSRIRPKCQTSRPTFSRYLAD